MGWIWLAVISALSTVVTCVPWNGPKESFRPTSTANWSPAPTNGLRQDLRVLRRDDFYPASVCGFIGGNVAQVAVCSAASSCAWNTDESYVGCCATSDHSCTFYTSCVDGNSPHTADEADVYTCPGTAVCYQNTYPNNFYQWGCGSSTWATFVATTVNGNPNALPVQVVFTGNAAPAAQPTTVLGSTETVVSTQVETKTAAPSPASTKLTSISEISFTSTSPTFSREQAASSSSEPTAASHSLKKTQTSSPATSIGGAAVSTSPSPTPSSSPTPSPKPLPIGAIVGGAIGGLALLFALLGFCFIGRRRGWFSSSDRNNNYNDQPQSMAYTGEGPPRYSTPLPVSYDSPPERKAELPVHPYDMRDSAGNDTYSGNGRDDVSPWGSPVPLSDGTFRSRSRLSPISVDEGYQRAGRNDPIYEVQ